MGTRKHPRIRHPTPTVDEKATFLKKSLIEEKVTKSTKKQVQKQKTLAKKAPSRKRRATYKSAIEIPVEPEIDGTFSHFNKSDDGELLDGNADVYRALGFGWVEMDDPTNASWSKFCREGGFKATRSRTIDTTLEIVDKNFPDWRTKGSNKSRSATLPTSALLPDSPTSPIHCSSL